MNILIVGKSGVGKSNLGDIIRNTIFKLDNNAAIKTDDPSRLLKTFGTGSNEYNISIGRANEWEHLLDIVEPAYLDGKDIIILLANQNFKGWFNNVYNLEKKLQDAANQLVEHLQLKYADWDGVKQFKDTPRRLVQMYEEFCWTPQKIAKELDTQFHVFEDGYDEMLVTGPISVWTLCPHHLLPVGLTVTIGCVPDKHVLGLSKFVRIAEVVGKRPIMQEQYSRLLADELMTRLKPKGIAVYVIGVHGCMGARGVKQKVDVTTSTLRGVFMDKPETRSEFYNIARTRSNEH